MTDATDGPIDPAEALASLKTIAPQTHPELLLVAAAEDEGFEVASAETTTNLASALRTIVGNYADEYTESSTMPYHSASEVSEGHLMWLPADQLPMLNADGIESAASDLPMVELVHPYIRRLRLSAIRVPTVTGQAVFYRAVSPSSAIGFRGKLPIVRRGDRFDVVDDRTLVLDRQIDAIVVGGIVFFDNRRRFQRIFGLLDELRKQAAQTFDEVTAGLRIENLDGLRQAATTQLQMLGKMASIAKKLEAIPAYRQALTMERLVEFVKAHPYTEVLIVGEGNAARLVFQPDVKHRFKILKLLDDDYLMSQLTDLAYEANSKGLPLDD
jgi:hypothetical protein